MSLRRLRSVVVLAVLVGLPLTLPAAPARAQGAATDGDDGDAFARLVTGLRSGESFRVRATAAVALGRTGEARAVPVLAEALRGDESYAVRAAACTSLGRLEDPVALPMIIDGLRDSDEYVRAAAEEALAHFHSPKLLFSFRELLTAPDEYARRAAVRAYGEVLRSPEASAGLARFVVDALGDDSELVVGTAEQALAALPRDRAIPLLLEGVRSSDSAVRVGCARLLQRSTDARAVEPLIDVVIDTDGTAEVRAAARAALRAHLEFVDVAHAIDDAGRPGAGRARALRVLAAVGHPRAAELIERALGEADAATRVAAARAAADLGGPRARASLEQAAAREAEPRQKQQLELLLKSMAR